MTSFFLIEIPFFPSVFCFVFALFSSFNVETYEISETEQWHNHLRKQTSNTNKRKWKSFNFNENRKLVRTFTLSLLVVWILFHALFITKTRALTKQTFTNLIYKTISEFQMRIYLRHPEIGRAFRSCIVNPQSPIDAKIHAIIKKLTIISNLHGTMIIVKIKVCKMEKKIIICLYYVWIACGSPFNDQKNCWSKCMHSK